MPKKLGEVKLFNSGTVSTVSDRDISPDSNIYSKNVEPVNEVGVLAPGKVHKADYEILETSLKDFRIKILSNFDYPTIGGIMYHTLKISFDFKLTNISTNADTSHSIVCSINSSESYNNSTHINLVGRLKSALLEINGIEDIYFGQIDPDSHDNLLVYTTSDYKYKENTVFKLEYQDPESGPDTNVLASNVIELVSQKGSVKLGRQEIGILRKGFDSYAIYSNDSGLVRSLKNPGKDNDLKDVGYIPSPSKFHSIEGRGNEVHIGSEGNNTRWAGFINHTQFGNSIPESMEMYDGTITNPSTVDPFDILLETPKYFYGCKRKVSGSAIYQIDKIFPHTTTKLNFGNSFQYSTHSGIYAMCTSYWSAWKNARTDSAWKTDADLKIAENEAKCRVFMIFKLTADSKFYFSWFDIPEITDTNPTLSKVEIDFNGVNGQVWNAAGQYTEKLSGINGEPWDLIETKNKIWIAFHDPVNKLEITGDNATKKITLANMPSKREEGTPYTWSSVIDKDDLTDKSLPLYDDLVAPTYYTDADDNTNLQRVGWWRDGTYDSSSKIDFPIQCLTSVYDTNKNDENVLQFLKISQNNSGNYPEVSNYNIHDIELFDPMSSYPHYISSQLVSTELPGSPFAPYVYMGYDNDHLSEGYDALLEQNLLDRSSDWRATYSSAVRPFQSDFEETGATIFNSINFPSNKTSGPTNNEHHYRRRFDYRNFQILELTITTSSPNREYKLPVIFTQTDGWWVNNRYGSNPSRKHLFSNSADYPEYDVDGESLADDLRIQANGLFVRPIKESDGTEWKIEKSNAGYAIINDSGAYESENDPGWDTRYKDLKDYVEFMTPKRGIATVANNSIQSARTIPNESPNSGQALQGGFTLGFYDYDKTGCIAVSDDINGEASTTTYIEGTHKKIEGFEFISRMNTSLKDKPLVDSLGTSGLWKQSNDDDYGFDNANYALHIFDNNENVSHPERINTEAQVLLLEYLVNKWTEYASSEALGVHLSTYVDDSQDYPTGTMHSSNDSDGSYQYTAGYEFFENKRFGLKAIIDPSWGTDVTISFNLIRPGYCPNSSYHGSIVPTENTGDWRWWDLNCTTATENYKSTGQSKNSSLIDPTTNAAYSGGFREFVLESKDNTKWVNPAGSAIDSNVGFDNNAVANNRRSLYPINQALYLVGEDADGFKNPFRAGKHWTSGDAEGTNYLDTKKHKYLNVITSPLPTTNDIWYMNNKISTDPDNEVIPINFTNKPDQFKGVYNIDIQGGSNPITRMISRRLSYDKYLTLISAHNDTNLGKTLVINSPSVYPETYYANKKENYNQYYRNPSAFGSYIKILERVINSGEYDKELGTTQTLSGVYSTKNDDGLDDVFLMEDSGSGGYSKGTIASVNVDGRIVDYLTSSQEVVRSVVDIQEPVTISYTTAADKKFLNNRIYYYALSLVYDNFQETPLSPSVTVTAPSNGVAQEFLSNTATLTNVGDGSESVPADTAYQNLATTTSGSGTGLLVNLSVDGDNVGEIGITVGAHGTGYAEGDKIGFTAGGVEVTPAQDKYRIAKLADNQGYHDITLRFEDSLNLNRRVSHMRVYGAYSVGLTSSIPDGLFREIGTIRLDTSWKRVAAVGDTPEYRERDFRVSSGEFTGPTFDAKTGFSETLKNITVQYGISTQLNGRLYVARCSHVEIEDASHYMFRSLPARYDSFNWGSEDNYLMLPILPSAMIAYAGRIVLFNDDTMIVANPNMYLEDKFDGTGCFGPNSLAVSKYGLCFASNDNIYLYDGNKVDTIGFPILKPNDYDSSVCWENIAKTLIANDETPQVVWDGKRNGFSIFFNKNNVGYVWMYNVLMRRWDLWSIDSNENYKFKSAFSLNGDIYIGGLANRTGDIDPVLMSMDKGSTYRGMTWIGTKFGANKDTQIKNFKNIKISYNVEGSYEDSSIPITTTYRTSASNDFITPTTITDDRVTSSRSSIKNVQIISGKSSYIQAKIDIDPFDYKIGFDAIGIIFREKKVK